MSQQYIDTKGNPRNTHKVPSSWPPSRDAMSARMRHSLPIALASSEEFAPTFWMGALCGNSDIVVI